MYDNEDLINNNVESNVINNSEEPLIVNEETMDTNDNYIHEKKNRITKKTKIIVIAVLASIVAVVILSFVLTYYSHPLTGRWKCISVDSTDSSVMLSDCIYDFSMYGDFTIEYPEDYEESENRIIQGEYHMHNNTLMLQYDGYSLEYNYKKEGNRLILTREIKNNDTSLFKIKDTVRVSMTFEAI